MERIRVIFVDIPRMLDEIIREVVAKEHDLELVDGVHDADNALAAIQASGACVVITHVQQPAGAGVDRLFGDRPQRRVLALSDDGRESCVYELRPHERLLGEVSAPSLLAAIRGQLAGLSRSPR